MKSRKITFSGMPEMNCAISYVDLDAVSPLNHNESHIHRECEIYLNLSGDVAFEVENHIYPVSRGSVIITRPYEYHHCIYRSNEQHCHYWIMFSAEYGAEFLKMFFQRQKGKGNLILLGEEQLVQICDVLEELLKEETDILRRRINFLRIFDILRRGVYGEEIDSGEGMPEDVSKVIRYMEDHLAEDMTIQTLSHVGNVGVTTLERHFKECFHASPFAVLRRKRLFYSMECLRDGDSVSDAAVKSGFPDYSNYIQLFRKQFGMTPLQYRKRFEKTFLQKS